MVHLIMLRKLGVGVLKDPMWAKVVTLCLILFFIFLADAILSFWVPTYVEGVYGPVLMGMILGFSSIIGLAADLIFPQILRGTTVKRLLFLGIVASLVFSLLLLNAAIAPIIAILLLAMAVWGIYYEFLGFAEQQFVADSTPLKLHSSVWGVLNVIRSVAYFLGPIVAGFTLTSGNIPTVTTAIIFGSISLGILFVTARHHQRRVQIEIHKVSLFGEIGHWVVLFKRVWGVVAMSLLLGLVDATFWTTGAVFTEKLSQISFWGKFFLPAYMLPPLFIGFMVARMKIVGGKKRLAAKFLIATGFCLTALIISDSMPFLILMVFMSSVMASVSYPLIDGVYSDVVARMGRERQHLIGLSRSAISLAYVIGPMMAGFVTSWIGERYTFVYLGISIATIATILLFAMPKKIKVPQGEIKKWE